MPPDTLARLLAGAAARLRQAGCETPDLDARLLLQHVTGLTREDLILDPGRAIAPQEAAQFEALLSRRERREPVSRILGEREFYGRVFEVTPAVLDPRPDTETLIEAALSGLPQGARILDLGTGSGAIILTLLAERPDTIGVAVDISPAALAVARSNAVKLAVAGRLETDCSNWFYGVSGGFHLIVSNPPYIPADDISGLSPDVRNYDPVLALTGGADGLDAYRAIAGGAAGHLLPGGRVLVEIGAGQAEDVATLFRQTGFTLHDTYRDLGGHLRCMAFTR